MSKRSAKKEIRVLGIDIGQNLSYLHGVDAEGHRVLWKQVSREKILAFMVDLKPCLVGLKACGGAHHLARTLKEMGHDVRIMAPQLLKPYVKGGKNSDLVKAICEAVQQPDMRFVSVKSIEQQDLHTLHRVRSMAVAHQTALINHTRILLMEYGIPLPEGSSHFRKQLPEILKNIENGATVALRELLGALRNELVYMGKRVDGFDIEITKVSQQNESCRLLQSIPGIGPLTATAFMAAVGDVRAFKSGREMVAWLGLVPLPHSTGDEIRPLGISKRGNAYLRMLLVHGARAALAQAPAKKDRLSRWVTELKKRRGGNVATVALAAKNVRIAWALLSKGEAFKVSDAV
ncbi:MAG: IS110 family transposase [Magnetococcales bacterium]|nr:IS110 family transposase [Magnetococcales bacterium]MBF0150544.1 IS110 family transposase [Magnetococcales bacterium]MBF0175101.1 IS110 family transposase [Magnetococcales bacterium]MBF0349253.1 IS110 family transposase [Magnetococcales bacterium]MBF0631761.1 IS110 family transposase [Magnetococcales bacterium]